MYGCRSEAMHRFILNKTIDKAECTESLYDLFGGHLHNKKYEEITYKFYLCKIKKRFMKVLYLN